MKILLLTPPAARMMNPATLEEDLVAPKTWVPLGIAYLASALRESGFDVQALDLHDCDWPGVESVLAGSGADVVGVSCFTFERANAMRTAALARRTLPGAAVVMGGPHATFFPGHILGSGDVDVVVLGQGEATMVELADCLDRGGDPAAVPGIAWLESGTVRRSPARRRTELDDMAFPDYGPFDLAQYKSPEIPPRYLDTPGTHVITSRGCPFHCRFCSVNHFFDGRWAFRSPRNVVDELEFLVAGQGVGHVYFSDDLFTLDRKRTMDICREIIDRKIDIAWMAETRVDCVDEEMLAWMRKAGCYRVYYGVESGSATVLKSINKGFTPDQVARAFAMTHAAGLEPCCFLMVGNPGETTGTIAETVELINAIRPATMPIIGITTILPGTDIYEMSKGQGLINDDYWLTDAPPPLYTGEYDVDQLIALQMLLTRGIAPEVYEQMCAMGFDDGYFQLRRMGRDFFGD